MKKRLSYKIRCVGFLVGACFLSADRLPADEAGAETQPLEAGVAYGEQLGYREMIKRLEPMGLGGLDPKIARIMSGFYSYNFTDEANWKRIESIRYQGVLRVGDEEFKLSALKKKPDFTKIELSKGGQAPIIMAFDGQDAWQVDMVKSVEPFSMPSEEALNFVRDAPFGGQLLYLDYPGKNIELKGVTVAEGRRCYELQVTLPNTQQITTMIGVADFRQHQRIVKNEVSGEQEVTTNLEFLSVDGIRLPKLSETRVGGDLVHSIEIDKVEINSGAAPWMFARRTAAPVPGSGPSVPPSRLQDPSINIRKIDTSTADFGTTFGEPSPFSDQNRSPEHAKELPGHDPDRDLER
ncbi:MAG: hypothetical protein ACON4O_08880 [Lentimonas sp.]